MNGVLKKLYLCGVVPVIQIKDSKDAAPLARALLRGGIDVCEVTFRTAAAADAIKNISNECPDMLVGAGTVLTKEQVDAATDAGARFIVSPGFNPDTVKYCILKNIPIIPGCSTCGEMEQAMALGLETVKFFPAEAFGGTAYLKAVSAPYKKLKFMPTGGIDEKNLASYLSLDNVIACGGSFMAPAKLIEQNKFDDIEKLASSAVDTVLGLQIKHIGINCENEDGARDVSSKLCKLLGARADERAGAIFAGSLFEVMKKPYLGKHGHIAVGTLSPDRARAHLEARGFEFDEKTASYDENGRLRVIYAKEEIGGFAFHLIRI